MPTELFYNGSNSIGIIINAWTQNVSGDLYLTLLAFVIGLLAFCFMFRIPIEFSAIIILPVLIVSMAYTSEFLAIGGLTLVYIGVLVAKWFIIK